MSWFVFAWPGVSSKGGPNVGAIWACFGNCGGLTACNSCQNCAISIVIPVAATGVEQALTPVPAPLVDPEPDFLTCLLLKLIWWLNL